LALLCAVSAPWWWLDFLQPLPVLPLFDGVPALLLALLVGAVGFWLGLGIEGLQP